MTRIIPEPCCQLCSEIFKLPVTIDAQGNQMDLEPKGFGTLSSESPVTGIPHSLDSVAKARDTLTILGATDIQTEATDPIMARKTA